MIDRIEGNDKVGVVVTDFLLITSFQDLVIRLAMKQSRLEQWSFNICQEHQQIFFLDEAPPATLHQLKSVDRIHLFEVLYNVQNGEQAPLSSSGSTIIVDPEMYLAHV